MRGGTRRRARCCACQSSHQKEGEARCATLLAARRGRSVPRFGACRMGRGARGRMDSGDRIEGGGAGLGGAFRPRGAIGTVVLAPSPLMSIAAGRPKEPDRGCRNVPIGTYHVVSGCRRMELIQKLQSDGQQIARSSRISDGLRRNFPACEEALPPEMEQLLRRLQRGQMTCAPSEQAIRLANGLGQKSPTFAGGRL